MSRLDIPQTGISGDDSSDENSSQVSDDCLDIFQHCLEHHFKLDFSQSVESTPHILNQNNNPSLKDVLYKIENGKVISAFDRFNFIFSWICQVYYLQVRIISGCDAVGEDYLDKSPRFDSFFDLLPDPCKIEDCARCILF